MSEKSATVSWALGPHGPGETGTLTIQTSPLLEALEARAGAKPVLGCPGVLGLLTFDKVNVPRLSRVSGRVAEVDEA